MEIRDDMNDSEAKIDRAMASFRTPFSDDSKELARAKVMLRIERLEKAQPLIVVHKPWTAWRAAAAVLLAVCIPFGLYYSGLKHIKADHTSELLHTLPDGSEVRLAQSAELKYHAYTWGMFRNVLLNGDAHFQVSRGSTFAVKASHAQIEVLGTGFSVYSSTYSTLVHCRSGSVRALSTGASVDLDAGSIVMATSHSGLGEVHAYGGPAYLAGTSQQDALHFEDAPLSLVCFALERWFGHPVRHSFSGSMHYSGTLFPDQKDETFLVLCKTFDAKLVVHDDVFTLTP